MLISHRRRFIYMKTVKTAGTSVEIFFEPECADPSSYVGPQHETAEIVSPFGIIGARGRFGPGATWYNHMPAARVLELVGRDVWDNYSKFCVIRNPFDKMVSWWWHQLPPPERMKAATSDFAVARSMFGDYLKTGEKFPVDRNVYCINDIDRLDFYIRYERLREGVVEVARRVGMDCDMTRLGRYKTNTRKRSEPFWDYYDETSIRIICDRFAFELEAFRYDCAP